MQKYELRMPSPDEPSEEPSIRLSRDFDRDRVVAVSLEIGWINDVLKYHGAENRGVEEARISRYAGHNMDARLYRLTPDQRTRLSGDTGVPVEEISEIADIEEENAGRLGKLLWEQHR